MSGANYQRREWVSMISAKNLTKQVNDPTDAWVWPLVDATWCHVGMTLCLCLSLYLSLSLSLHVGMHGAVIT